MSNRINAARQYLANLVITYEMLEQERQQLLAAASRIAEIQAEKQELLDDAQEALVKYNALTGENYTLQDIRDRFTAKPPTPPVAPPVP